MKELEKQQRLPEADSEREVQSRSQREARTRREHRQNLRNLEEKALGYFYPILFDVQSAYIPDDLLRDTNINSKSVDFGEESRGEVTFIWDLHFNILAPGSQEIWDRVLTLSLGWDDSVLVIAGKNSANIDNPISIREDDWQNKVQDTILEVLQNPDRCLRRWGDQRKVYRALGKSIEPA